MPAIIRRLLCALAVTGLVLASPTALVPAASSALAGSGGTTTAWIGHTVPCATGAITSTSVSGGTVTINGWIQPCSAPDSDDFFAVGWFPDGSLTMSPRQGYVYLPMFYANPGSVSVTNVTFHWPAGGNEILCLASHYKSLQACARIQMVNGAAVITVIPPSSLGPFTLVDEPGHFPDPKCGTCW